MEGRWDASALPAGGGDNKAAGTVERQRWQTAAVMASTRTQSGGPGHGSCNGGPGWRRATAGAARGRGSRVERFRTQVKFAGLS